MIRKVKIKAWGQLAAYIPEHELHTSSVYNLVKRLEDSFGQFKIDKSTAIVLVNGESIANLHTDLNSYEGDVQIDIFPSIHGNIFTFLVIAFIAFVAVSLVVQALIPSAVAPPVSDPGGTNTGSASPVFGTVDNLAKQGAIVPITYGDEYRVGSAVVKTQIIGEGVDLNNIFGTYNSTLREEPMADIVDIIGHDVILQRKDVDITEYNTSSTLDKLQFHYIQTEDTITEASSIHIGGTGSESRQFVMTSGYEGQYLKQMQGSINIALAQGAEPTITIYNRDTTTERFVATVTNVLNTSEWTSNEQLTSIAYELTDITTDDFIYTSGGVDNDRNLTIEFSGFDNFTQNISRILPSILIDDTPLDQYEVEVTTPTPSIQNQFYILEKDSVNLSTTETYYNYPDRVTNTTDYNLRWQNAVRFNRASAHNLEIPSDGDLYDRTYDFTTTNESGDVIFSHTGTGALQFLQKNRSTRSIVEVTKSPGVLYPEMLFSMGPWHSYDTSDAKSKGNFEIIFNSQRYPVGQSASNGFSSGLNGIRHIIPTNSYLMTTNPGNHINIDGSRGLDNITFEIEYLIATQFGTGGDQTGISTNLKYLGWNEYLLSDRDTLIDKNVDETTENNNYTLANFRVSSKFFGDNVPKREYIVAGEQCLNLNTNLHERSSNVAWQIYDMLTNKEFGMGFLPTQIDEASFIRVANYCEEAFTFNTGATFDSIVPSAGTSEWDATGTNTITIDTTNKLGTGDTFSLGLNQGNFNGVFTPRLSGSGTGIIRLRLNYQASAPIYVFAVDVQSAFHYQENPYIILPAGTHTNVEVFINTTGTILDFDGSFGLQFQSFSTVSTMYIDEMEISLSPGEGSRVFDTTYVIPRWTSNFSIRDQKVGLEVFNNLLKDIGGLVYKNKDDKIAIEIDRPTTVKRLIGYYDMINENKLVVNITPKNQRYDFAKVQFKNRNLFYAEDNVYIDNIGLTTTSPTSQAIQSINCVHREEAVRIGRRVVYKSNYLPESYNVTVGPAFGNLEIGEICALADNDVADRYFSGKIDEAMTVSDYNSRIIRLSEPYRPQGDSTIVTEKIRFYSYDDYGYLCSAPITSISTDGKTIIIGSSFRLPGNSSERDYQSGVEAVWTPHNFKTWAIFADLSQAWSALPNVVNAKLGRIIRLTKKEDETIDITLEQYHPEFQTAIDNGTALIELPPRKSWLRSVYGGKPGQNFYREFDDGLAGTTTYTFEADGGSPGE